MIIVCQDLIGDAGQRVLEEAAVVVVEVVEQQVRVARALRVLQPAPAKT